MGVAAYTRNPANSPSAALLPAHSAARLALAALGQGQSAVLMRSLALPPGRPTDAGVLPEAGCEQLLARVVAENSRFHLMKRFVFFPKNSVNLNFVYHGCDRTLVKEPLKGFAVLPETKFLLSHIAHYFYKAADPVQFALDCSDSLFFSHGCAPAFFGVIIMGMNPPALFGADGVNPARISVRRIQRNERLCASANSRTVEPKAYSTATCFSFSVRVFTALFLSGAAASAS
jgi:hypothetical protein